MIIELTTVGIISENKLLVALICSAQAIIGVHSPKFELTAIVMEGKTISIRFDAGHTFYN